MWARAAALNRLEHDRILCSGHKVKTLFDSTSATGGGRYAKTNSALVRQTVADGQCEHRPVIRFAGDGEYFFRGAIHQRDDSGPTLPVQYPSDAEGVRELFGLPSPNIIGAPRALAERHRGNLDDCAV